MKIEINLLTMNHISSPYTGDTNTRIDFAEFHLVRGKTNSRAFCTCFESGDGDAVVAGLVDRAKTNLELGASLRGVISDSSLREFGGDFLFN